MKMCGLSVRCFFMEVDVDVEVDVIPSRASPDRNSDHHRNHRRDHAKRAPRCPQGPYERRSTKKEFVLYYYIIPSSISAISIRIISSATQHHQPLDISYTGVHR